MINLLKKKSKNKRIENQKLKQNIKLLFRSNKNNFYFSIIFLLISLDLFLKKITTDMNFFLIRSVKNYGISLGFLNRFPTIISIISVLILVYVLYLLYINKKIIFKNNILKISSILIISGAISNTLDRIFLGYVRDYIYMYFFVNNLADIYISIAIIILLIFYKRIENNDISFFNENTKITNIIKTKTKIKNKNKK